MIVNPQLKELLQFAILADLNNFKEKIKSNPELLSQTDPLGRNAYYVSDHNSFYLNNFFLVLPESFSEEQMKPIFEMKDRLFSKSVLEYFWQIALARQIAIPPVLLGLITPVLTTVLPALFLPALFLPRFLPPIFNQKAIFETYYSIDPLKKNLQEISKFKFARNFIFEKLKESRHALGQHLFKKLIIEYNLSEFK